MPVVAIESLADFKVLRGTAAALTASAAAAAERLTALQGYWAARDAQSEAFVSEPP